MGILFNVGNEADEKDLDLAMRRATWPDGRPLFTPWTAVGLMVFFALCSQCLSTLATIRRETGGWRWPAFVFVYMTALAYIAAVGINALGRAFGG
jgi:ferrous iron transport protein B